VRLVVLTGALGQKGAFFLKFLAERKARMKTELFLGVILISLLLLRRKRKVSISLPEKGVIHYKKAANQDVFITCVLNNPPANVPEVYKKAIPITRMIAIFASGEVSLTMTPATANQGLTKAEMSTRGKYQTLVEVDYQTLPRRPNPPIPGDEFDYWFNQVRFWGTLRGATLFDSHLHFRVLKYLSMCDTITVVFPPQYTITISSTFQSLPEDTTL
jgi:hypothetical protein